jgi:hypothetical protein
MIDVVVGRPPAHSLLASFLEGCDFHDAYEVALADPSETPSQLFARAIRATPAWVDLAMALRDRLVSLVGLKTVGAMGARRPPGAMTARVGEAYGIFTVLAANPDELLLGIDDKHLDVRVSVARRVDSNGARAVVTTAVRNHNWLGRLYMIPVARIHPLVVKGMLRAL